MSRWVTDMSPGFTVAGPVLTNAPNAQETNPCNAMWEEGDGVSSGQHYWKIHFQTLEGEAGVGITSKDYFKPGYECKTLQYLAGDLSNGSRNGRLVIGFGERPREGDVIGMLVVFEEKKLKVYFDINGENLGLAYSVSETTLNLVFPMVTFFNSGSAVCTKQEEIPEEITIRAPPKFIGIEGNWKLLSWKEDDIALDVYRRVSSKFTLPETEKCVWCSKVTRSFRSTLLKEDGNWNSRAVIIDKTTNSDAEALKHEKVLINLMSNVTTIELADDGTLSVSSDTISSFWKRYDATPGPFLGDPFD